MSDTDKPRAGEPADPIDAYDRQHGEPQEKDVRANPPVATPDTERRSFTAK